MLTGGSSPPTRGTRLHELGHGLHHGIIPAYAGNTPRRSSRSPWKRDHPRLRGEHWRVSGRQGPRRGSSPPTRGTPSGRSDCPLNPGIIPAYAGNTRHGAHRGNHPRDHPRLRGEHPEAVGWPTDAQGSSPPTRGTQRQGRLQRLAHGIIPAYAGNTCAAHWPAATRGDHPRLRGEHSPAIWPPQSHPGSSPPTRGTHFVIIMIPMDIEAALLHFHSLCRHSLSAETLSGQGRRTATSLVFTRRSPFAGITPTRTTGIGFGSLLSFRSFDKLQPIAIHRNPISMMNPEREVLLIARGIHHDCPPIPHQSNNPLPQLIPNSGADMTDEDTSRYFQ
ncbi:hypothetical protein DSM100685_1830 [Bifidobacterium avesanii]|nr:hypothetical protein DSM100685_1830 [Bifidobacterium avesanii]